MDRIIQESERCPAQVDYCVAPAELLSRDGKPVDPAGSRARKRVATSATIGLVWIHEVRRFGGNAGFRLGLPSTSRGLAEDTKYAVLAFCATSRIIFSSVW